MLEWLIVGGGIHGVHHALMLRMRGVPADALRIVDPHAVPLARWRSTTQVTGMQYLRSPIVHHLAADPWSLKRFARQVPATAERSYITTYKRPSLSLFDAHARREVERVGLAGCWIQGRADGLRRTGGGWELSTCSGAIPARRVLIAIGLTEQPLWPAWAARAAADGAQVGHLFTGDALEADAGVRWLVAGGGSSGVQFALRAAERWPGRVTLLLRRAPRISHFDADQAWMGPKRLDGFHGQPDMRKRRMLIQQGRLPGTVPPEVRARLSHAVMSSRIDVVIDEVAGTAVSAGGRTEICTRGGRLIAADRIVLATGADPRRPGGDWLDRAVADFDLPVAPCGYPVVDRRLCWAAGLHVTGPLAELEIGPVARNILGARFAAERLAEAA
jgi:cation diffusion facilitator CzcD-associated flavoprotein CzcO